MHGKAELSVRPQRGNRWRVERGEEAGEWLFSGLFVTASVVGILGEASPLDLSSERGGGTDGMDGEDGISGRSVLAKTDKTTRV